MDQVHVNHQPEVCLLYSVRPQAMKHRRLEGSGVPERQHAYYGIHPHQYTEIKNRARLKMKQVEIGRRTDGHRDLRRKNPALVVPPRAVSRASRAARCGTGARNTKSVIDNLSTHHLIPARCRVLHIDKVIAVSEIVGRANISGERNKK